MYNGHDNRQDEGDAICKADGDNFYLAGNSLFWSPGPSIRPFVVKINAFGDTLWARSLILNGNHGGWAYALLPMWDGGCAVTGRSDPRYIARLNKNGAIIWQYQYPGDADFYDIKKAVNGDYICSGLADSGGTALRVDTLGNLKWSKNFPTFALHDIVTTPDNGCLISGYTNPHQAIVIKLDVNGNIVNTKYYKINNQLTLSNNFERDGSNYILCGNYYNGTKDVPYFLKLDQNLNPLDTHIFVQVRDEIVLAMKVKSPGRYVWTFYFQSGSSSDSSFNRMLVTDVSGNIIYNRIKKFGGLPTDEYFQEIQPVDNGDVIFFGDAEYYLNPSDHDMYAVRTDSMLNYPSNIIGIEPVSNFIPDKVSFSNYPNPFNPTTKIRFALPNEAFVKLVVYDMLGREVATLVNEQLNPGTYEVDLDGTNHPSGVYYYKLTVRQAGSSTGDPSVDGQVFTETRKMVLVK